MIEIEIEVETHVTLDSRAQTIEGGPGPSALNPHIYLPAPKGPLCLFVAAYCVVLLGLWLLRTKEVFSVFSISKRNCTKYAQSEIRSI